MSDEIILTRLISKDGMRGRIEESPHFPGMEIKTVLNNPLAGMMCSELGVEDGPMIAARTYRYKRKRVCVLIEYEEI